MISCCCQPFRWKMGFERIPVGQGRLRKQIALLAFLMITWPFVARSADLARVAQDAIDNSIELKRLEQAVLSSKAGESEKWGRFTPTVELSAVHTRADQDEPVDTDREESEYSISVTQPLYRPNLLLDQREAALRVETAHNQLLQTHETILKQTLAIVFSICRIQLRIEVTQKSKALVQKTVEIQGRMLTTGYGSRIDLAEAEVELARYQKDHQDLKAQLRLLLWELEDITGTQLKADDFSSIARALLRRAPRFTLQSPDQWLETAYRSNSQLKLIQVNLRLNQVSRDRGYSALKPRVDLKVTYQQAEEEVLVKSRVDETSVELRLSMAFTPVSTFYQVRKQDIEQQVLQMESAKVKKDLKDKINRLLQSTKLKRRNMVLQQQWQDRQKRVVDMYQEGLKQKHFSFSRFLDNSRKYNESRVDLIQTAVGIWEDRLQLMQLAGLLTLDTVSKLSRELSGMVDAN